MPFNTYAEQKIIVLGDLNNNSKVNLEDAMISLKGAVGILTLDKEQENVADVNADEKINLQDTLGKQSATYELLAESLRISTNEKILL